MNASQAVALTTVVLIASWLEGLWVWLLGASLAEVDGQAAPSIEALGLVIFAAWLAARAVAGLAPARRRAVAVGGGLVVALTAGTIHAGLAQPLQWAIGAPTPDYRASGAVLALLVAYLWGRGLSLAVRVNRQRIVTQVGTTTFLLVMILLLLPLTNTVAELGTPIVMACFFLAVATLLLVQLAENESYRLTRAQWMGLGLAGTGALVGTGSMLAGILSAGFLGVWLRPVGQLAMPFNNAVLRAASYIAEDFTLFLIWLRQLAGGDPEAIQRAQQEADQTRFHFETQSSYGPPEVMTTLAFLLVSAVVIYWFSQLFSRLAHAAERRIGTGILETRLAEIGAGPGLNGLFSALLHGRSPGSSDGLAGRASQIRRHYRAFQGMMARAAMPREPGQTPREYAAHLGRQLPAAAPPLTALTDAYLLARYAPPGSPLPDPSTVAGAIREVRRSLRDGPGA